VLGISMQLGGPISSGLTDVGSDLVAAARTLTVFHARRGSSGSSGTTTIELEINGVATGDTLSWPSTDADFVLKTAVISEAVSAGDRVSFKTNAAEVGASDIFAQVA
jgi:hypothetical protein